MESANWDNIASRIKENSDVEVIFGEIAVRGAQPPIGAITRLLLITWAKVNGPHDRLLSVVLGSNDRSSKIILDLMESDLESALSASSRLKCRVHLEKYSSGDGADCFTLELHG